ncbi:MAG: diaminopimelate epimerase [Luteimonas sp.]
MATAPQSPALRFTKMHGAGNDFVVLDLRHGMPAPSPALSRRLGDRHQGVGCDQILTIEPPRSDGSIASYRIWNSDGSNARQCGNGARCVAAWLVRDGAVHGDSFVLDSPGDRHLVQRLDDDGYRIAMGVPQFSPQALPLLGFPETLDSYQLELEVPGLGRQAVHFGAVSIGNPHVLVEVDDIVSAPVASLGAALQMHPAFPDSANVGFVQVLAADQIRLRVFERGAGETLACGSGACAAVAILVRRGRVGRDVAVALPGGSLRIGWHDDAAPITMAGPATFVFEGELAPMEQDT